MTEENTFLHKDQLKQEENLIAQSYQNKTTFRRGKNDPILQRNFFCYCGKSYYSKAALCTHQKLKHNKNKSQANDDPQISIIEQKITKKVNKKGRPAYVSNLHCKKGKQFNNSNEEELESAFFNLENFFICYSQIIDNFTKQDYENYKLPDIFELEIEEIDPIKAFPLQFFQNENEFLTIYNALQSNFEHVELKYLYCCQIYAYFLQIISKYIKRQTYQEICLFLCILNQATNLFFSQNPSYMQQQNLTNLLYEENFYFDYVLRIVWMRGGTNFVINNFQQILKEQYQQLNLKIIVSENNLVIENLVFEFLNWLYYMSITDIQPQKSINLNEQNE